MSVAQEDIHSSHAMEKFQGELGKVVAVASDRMSGGNGREGLQDGDITHIARVKDDLTALECDQCLGAKEAVGIRNQPDAREGHGLSEGGAGCLA
jgi:hypothetical protein